MIHWLLVDGEVWENSFPVCFALCLALIGGGGVGALVSCARLDGDVVVKMRHQQMTSQLPVQTSAPLWAGGKRTRLRGPAGGAESGSSLRRNSLSINHDQLTLTQRCPTGGG